MEDHQELLFAALKKLNSDGAEQILLEHPELTNMKWTDDFEQEVTTPLIVACRYGKQFCCCYHLLSYNIYCKIPCWLDPVVQMLNSFWKIAECSVD